MGCPHSALGHPTPEEFEQPSLLTGDTLRPAEATPRSSR
jgi:hypothetical protein